MKALVGIVILAFTIAGFEFLQQPKEITKTVITPPKIYKIYSYTGRDLGYMTSIPALDRVIYSKDLVTWTIKGAGFEWVKREEITIK